MKTTLILLATILSLNLNADIVGDVYVSDMAGHDKRLTNLYAGFFGGLNEGLTNIPAFNTNKPSLQEPLYLECQGLSITNIFPTSFVFYGGGSESLIEIKDMPESPKTNVQLRLVLSNNYTNTVTVGTNEFRIKHTLVTNIQDVVTFERVGSK